MLNKKKFTTRFLAALLATGSGLNTAVPGLAADFNEVLPQSFETLNETDVSVPPTPTEAGWTTLELSNGVKIDHKEEDKLKVVTDNQVLEKIKTEFSGEFGTIIGIFSCSSKRELGKPYWPMTIKNLPQQYDPNFPLYVAEYSFGEDWASTRYCYVDSGSFSMSLDDERTDTVYGIIGQQKSSGTTIFTADKTTFNKEDLPAAINFTLSYLPSRDHSIDEEIQEVTFTLGNSILGDAVKGTIELLTGQRDESNSKVVKLEKQSDGSFKAAWQVKVDSVTTSANNYGVTTSESVTVQSSNGTTKTIYGKPLHIEFHGFGSSDNPQTPTQVPFPQELLKKIVDEIGGYSVQIYEDGKWQKDETIPLSMEDVYRNDLLGSHYNDLYQWQGRFKLKSKPGYSISGVEEKGILKDKCSSPYFVATTTDATGSSLLIHERPTLYLIPEPDNSIYDESTITFKSNQTGRVYTLPLKGLVTGTKTYMYNQDESDGPVIPSEANIWIDRHACEKALSAQLGHKVSLTKASNPEVFVTAAINEGIYEWHGDKLLLPYKYENGKYVKSLYKVDVLFNENANSSSGGSSSGTSKPANPSKPTGDSAPVVSYRLYNPNTGEHFYTTNKAEHDMLKSVGWNSEFGTWKLPTKSDYPIYRLYNPNSGDHHYTLNESEKNALVGYGWKDEGIGMYSAADDGEVIYRLYNPNAKVGQHHYTNSKAEKDMLVKAGWNDEGTGWYGLK